MKTVLAWSSGKDSAWVLQALRAEGAAEVVGLVTTVEEGAGRVPVHAVPEALLDLQAAAVGLPLVKLPLPHPCPNATYEKALRAYAASARGQGVAAMAFGDLFLDDLRAYRERLLEGTGLRPLFPLWRMDTGRLARAMVAGGLRALLTTVDTDRLDAAFAGRAYDLSLLDALPAGVDPCGERGEFHTFVHAGPMMRLPVPVLVGEAYRRGASAHVALRAAGTGAGTGAGTAAGTGAGTGGMPGESGPASARINPRGKP